MSERPTFIRLQHERGTTSPFQENISSAASEVEIIEASPTTRAVDADFQPIISILDDCLVTCEDWAHVDSGLVDIAATMQATKRHPRDRWLRLSPAVIIVGSCQSAICKMHDKD